MADSVEGSQSRQADSSEIRDDVVEVAEPELKKFKSDIKDISADYKLEERLTGILCCAVCLDIPNLWMYQCTNGHLMCTCCLSHLLADARLKDETATCPGCRCEISRTLCTRNLAVEKAISEMPASCQFCNRILPRNAILRHESEVCQESRQQLVVKARWINDQCSGRARSSGAYSCRSPPVVLPSVTQRLVNIVNSAL